MSILDLVSGQKVLELWALDSESGEIDPVLDGLWDELQGSIKDKVESYCHVIREFELLAKARAEEAERIQALADSDQAKAKSLKAKLLYIFGLQGVDKLETKSFRLSVCQNGGSQPIEVVVPVEELPEACRKVEVRADMEKIRELVKSGVPINGVNVLPRGQHLRIK